MEPAAQERTRTTFTFPPQDVQAAEAAQRSYMDHRLRKLMPDFSWMDRYPVLRPLHKRVTDHTLWSFDRDAVARGVALGLFFGVLTPVAQILFAAIVAFVIRANLPVAAAATLITNPLTFPIIYFAAWRIGSSFVNGHARYAADVELSEGAAEQALDVVGWFPTLINWATSVGPPLLIGVVILAFATATTAFLVVHLIWYCVERLKRH